MKKTTKILLVGIFFVTISVYVSAQDYIIIVNSSNTVSELTKKQVSKYFLKKKSLWPNRAKVYPVDMKASSNVRKNFSKDIHNKSVGQVKSYWQQSVFSGKASPPLEKDSDQAILEYVKANKGAIAYVSKNANITGVKEIIIK